MSLWARVGELVDSAPSLSALRAHRLHLLAASRWRASGQPVPAALRDEERRAAMIALAVAPVLERAVGAYAGPLMLMKGPEVAARYLEPATRPFRDLDLLADNAPAAQKALIAAGFVEFGEPDRYVGLQHLCPLVWPGLPLVVEIHSKPNQPLWLAAAPVERLLAGAVPSATGIAGLLAPAPPAHALLLAAHAWAHAPLGRLVDTVDLAAVLPAREFGAASAVAAEWGWDGLWRVNAGVARSLFGDPAGEGLPAWAGHLASARDRSVLENHIARVAAPAASLSARRALAAVGRTLARTAQRRDNEAWRDKLRRSRLAVAHALMEKSNHERSI
jgi:hypothetical protein